MEVPKCFVAVNSKISILKKLNTSGKQNLGNIKSYFGPRGQIFGGEVIVFVQCVWNCWSLRLWFPELSKAPYMIGGK